MAYNICGMRPKFIFDTYDSQPDVGEKMYRVLIKRFEKTAAVGFFLAGLSCATLAQAATVTTSAFGRTSCTTSTDGVAQDNGTTNAAINISTGQGGCSAAISARAGAGYVGVRGNLSSSPVPGTGTYEMQASGASFMRGITISPGAGRTTADLLAQYGQFIDITVNASVSGTLTGIVSPGDTQFARVAGVLMGGSVELITPVGRDMQSASANYGFNTIRDPKVSGTNFLGANLRPSVLADWQQAFQVNFRFGGNGNIGGFADTNAFADFDGFNSLSFATDGPAFILPDGFTVNAPELNIFDNQWIDPRADPSVVPLPAGLPLLLGAIAFLGLTRRKAGQA